LQDITEIHLLEEAEVRTFEDVAMELTHQGVEDRQIEVTIATVFIVIVVVR